MAKTATHITVDGERYDLQDAELAQDVSDLKNAVDDLDGGLSQEAKIALLACFEYVAWIDGDGQIYYDALKNALNSGSKITLESITATFNQGSNVIYDDATLDSLKQYLTVTANYSDGSTTAITGYTLSGTLVAGTSTITVAYGGKTATFNVTVTHKEATLQSITAVFNQGSNVIYDDAALEDLKQYLTVTANYSDSTSVNVTNYSLSGTLTAGTSTITVTYENKTTTFNVTVTHREAILQSITAVFNQGSTVIYDDAALDDLKQYLTVTGHYSDSTTATITGYTLSGTLAAGTSTITVSYNNKTATFNVTVTHKEATLESITATFNQGSNVIYTNSSLNDLKPYLVVTANYSDGSTQIVTEYDLSGTLTAGESIITASYVGKIDTFSVTVTDSSTPIPSGYTLKSYVQSNGDAYIDTGYRLTVSEKSSVPFTSSFEGKFAVSAVSENKNLFGYQGDKSSTSSYRFMAFIKVDDGNLYYYGRNSGASDAVHGWEPSGINEISVYFYGYTKDFPEFIINGVQTTGNKVRPMQHSNEQGTVYLCAQNYKASGPTEKDKTVDGGYIRCYGFKIYEYTASTENTTVAMNFKPCVRNSDGVAGFYETVNGMFYPSIGGNAFVAGD